MLYALSVAGEKILPRKKLSGKCPDCGEVLIPKCGEIVLWHWAHQSGTDCEHWGEPEGEWHLEWKTRWPKECVEVPVIKNGKRHRADIRTPDGMVIELQHSSISTEEIHERESFYGNMAWVFDEIEKHELGNMEFNNRYSTILGTYYHLHWKHPRRSLEYVTRPVYLDLPNGSLPHSGNMFKLKKIKEMDFDVFYRDFQGYDYTKEYDKLPFGWGYSYSRKMFSIWFGANLAKEPS